MIGGDQPPPPPPPYWYPPPPPYSTLPPPPPQSYGPPPPLHHHPSPPPPHPLQHQQWSQQYNHHQPPPPPPPPHVPYHDQLPPSNVPYPSHLPPEPYRYPAPPLPPRGPSPLSHHVQPHISPYPAPQAHQAWENVSWPQQQGWEYAERNVMYNNNEDWAAKAREWAATKASTDNHYIQPQYSAVGNGQPQAYREHNQQGYSGDAVHRDGYVVSPSQRSAGPSSFDYEQEVPYCYSSGAGARDPNGSFPVPSIQSNQEGLPRHPSLPSMRLSMEPPYIGSGRGHATDSMDMPLVFEPRSGPDHNTHLAINYGQAEAAAPMDAMKTDTFATSSNLWTPPVAPGFAFPQNAAPDVQFDASFVSQPSVPVHSASGFGRTTGPSFPSTVPSVGQPFGLGNGSLHAPGFPGDSGGTVSISERPKKAAVPNWLRDEIIKQKTSLTGDVIHSDTAQNVGQSPGDQPDNKSIDSSRSAENEEDDEEDVEAVRAAAINQEIKRVLTEVLLKVTDELFDEIANKVLDEDDPTAEADISILPENHKNSPEPLVSSIPKASAKILLPAKPKGVDDESDEENSSSASPGGNILGLASYASDDDEGKPDGSTLPASRTKNGSPQLGSNRGEDVVRQVEDINEFADNKEPSEDDKIKEQKGISRSISKAAGDSGEKFFENSNSTQVKANIGKQEGASLHSRANGSNERTLETRRLTSTSRQQSERIRNDQAKEVKARSDSHEKLDHDDPARDDTSGKIQEKKERENKVAEGNEDAHIKHGAEKEASDYRSSSKHGFKNEKESSKDIKGKVKEDGNRKRDRVKDDKEAQLLQFKDARHERRRSPSPPSSRGRASKENSAAARGSVSSEEPSEAKKRKVQSQQRNSSPSPKGSRTRRNSRSPNSKHSHRGHTHTSERRRRSRSRSPVPRRSSHRY